MAEKRMMWEATLSRRKFRPDDEGSDAGKPKLQPEISNEGGEGSRAGGSGGESAGIT